MAETPRYRVTVDKAACDGIFACLTRDPRFVEDEDGLATIDPDADPVPPEGADGGAIRHEGGQVIATFADEQIDEARQAAAACPPNAITVTELAADGGNETADTGGADE